MSKLLAPYVDEETRYSQVIEAVFPSDDVILATKRINYYLENTEEDRKKAMMVFEPWQIRVNDKEGLLFFSDVSHPGFLYAVDFQTGNGVKKRWRLESYPHYFDLNTENGTLIYSGDNDCVECMDCVDGKIIWSTPLNKPKGVCVGRDEIYVAESLQMNIVALSKHDGSVLRKFGKKGKGYGEFLQPHDLALDNHGNLIVCDMGNHRIQVISSVDGTLVTQFGRQGSGKGEFSYPKGVTFDKHRSLIIVSDTMNHRIQVFDEMGNYIKSFRGSDEFSGHTRPIGICISYKLHELIVCDFANYRIQTFKSWRVRPHTLPIVMHNHCVDRNFVDISIKSVD